MANKTTQTVKQDGKTYTTCLMEGPHEVKTGILYVGGSATVRAYDSATVRAYDSATVLASGSATVEAYDSAIVEACRCGNESCKPTINQI